MKRKKETIMGKLIDLTGNRFGRLTVLGFSNIDNNRSTHWHCECDCGKICIVNGNSLKRGLTRSCGCLNREMSSKRLITHNKSYTQTYKIWSGIKRRCCNPNEENYKNYGGRGIKICHEWNDSFEIFYRDMGERPQGTSIERIDPNGDYCKDNCRWATTKEQCNNRTNNRYIEYNGNKRTIAQWSEVLNIKYGTLYNRIYAKKWSVEKAFTTP